MDEKFPTGVDIRDSVLLSVTGDGDPPFTPAGLDAAVRKDTKTYAGGFTSDRSVTLTGVVKDVPTILSANTVLVTLAEGDASFRVEVTNRDTFTANPPKPGDTITLVGNVNNFGIGAKPLNFRGLLLTK